MLVAAIYFCGLSPYPCTVPRRCGGFGFWRLCHPSVALILKLPRLDIDICFQAGYIVNVSRTPETSK